jgi:hypothetical protein
MKRNLLLASIGGLFFCSQVIANDYKKVALIGKSIRVWCICAFFVIGAWPSFGAKMFSNIPQQVSSADIIFQGRVVDVADVFIESKPWKRVRFDVVEKIKDTQGFLTGNTVEFYLLAGLRGNPTFSEGEHVILLAYQYPGLQDKSKITIGAEKYSIVQDERSGAESVMYMRRPVLSVNGPNMTRIGEQKERALSVHKFRSILKKAIQEAK